MLTCVKLSVTAHVSEHGPELLAVQTPKINVYLGGAPPLAVCSVSFTHTLIISINVRNICKMQRRDEDRQPLIQTAA